MGLADKHKLYYKEKFLSKRTNRLMMRTQDQMHSNLS